MNENWGQVNLTPAEQQMSAATAYSENTHGTVAEHEAIVSVIVNRADSGEQQYVGRNQADSPWWVGVG